MAAIVAGNSIQPHSFLADNGAEYRRPNRTLLAKAISTALIAGIANSPLLAQELEIEEIIVTATKRAESVMDVPLAIQALSGDFIREVNLNDVKDLVQFTPGVTGNSKDSFIDNVRVRGIVTNDFGNGGDPSIGMYKNGLYQGRTGSGVFSLFDIDRAEILRGPQGFLFGRNSISGAMNVHTTRPVSGQRDGYVELNIGERGVFEFEGGVNLTVSDTFSVRVAGQHMQEDGYITNIQTGNKFIDLDKTAVRVTGVYDNDDNLDIMLMAEYEDRDQSGTVYRANGEAGSYALLESIYGDLELAPGLRQVSIDEPPNGIFDIGEILSLSMEINVDTSVGTFTSLTGYKDHDYAYTEDFDATILRIFDYEQDQSGTYFEQEFRLVSDSEGPLNWYAGVSFYQEDIDSRFLGRQDEEIYCNVYWGNSCQGIFDYYNNAYGGAYAYVLDYYFGTYTWAPSPTGTMEDWNETVGKFSGYAAYVDLNFQFTDTIDASFGIRYNYDEKEFSQQVLSGLNPSPVLGPRVQTGYFTPNGPITDTRDWDDTTYRVGVNFRPNDDTLLYVNVATGYKQGGFNSFSLDPTGTAPWGMVQAVQATHLPGSFNAETSISYELGYKGTLADGRAQLSLNAFVHEFEDLQSFCSTTTPVATVCNVGTIDGQGLEGSLNIVLSENWQLMGGLSYLDTEANDIQDFCAGGERVFGTADACEGQSVPGAPEWTAFAALDAAYPVGNGTWFGNLAWSWEDERRSGWLPLTPESTTFPEGARMIDGFSLGQLTVGYRAQSNWTAALYVENLTDEVYFDGGNTGGNPNNPYVQFDWGPGRPRTAGARFTYNFD
jgi:iron complex outermembrane receptor protein